MAPDDALPPPAAGSSVSSGQPSSPATPTGDGEEGVKRVGRYELLERIGRGGMGVVYRAKDSGIGRLVAVKMLISDIDVSDETRERFFREARSAGQLTHRNIITIYDFGEEAGRAYIVMELLTGESLTNLLARGVKLPLEQQVEIMMRVSEGLAFAHSRGIIHRDVKPANLFVTTDGQVKILDFGVARIASSKLTRSGLLVGTPDYMSPEQVMGQVVDQRSDVFSAGAVFYQLLTGKKPFAAKRLPDVLNRVRLEAPEAITEAEAPAELTAIVMKALEKDPTQRYQRIVEMLASLTKFMQSWDRETRQIAAQAFERYAENAALIAGRPPAAAGDPDAEVAADPFLRELPLFQDRGPEVLKVVPFRRARIQEIVAALDAQRDRLLTAKD
jgi:serine/threonine-protein kinase